MIKRNMVEIELAEDELREAVVEYLKRKGIECNGNEIVFDRDHVMDFVSCSEKLSVYSYTCKVKGLENRE